MLLAFYSYGRQAGKDTAGKAVEAWCKENNLTYQRLAFADVGKLLVAEALGIRRIGNLSEDIEDVVNRVDAFKLYGRVDIYLDAFEPGPGIFDSISGRDFIINLLGEGPTSGARLLFGNDFWTKQVLPDGWAPTVDVTVITDLRWPEEADRVHKFDGRVIEIINDHAEHKGGRSEEGLSSSYIDHRIWNKSSMAEYSKAVKKTVSTIMGMEYGRRFND